MFRIAAIVIALSWTALVAPAAIVAAFLVAEVRGSIIFDSFNGPDLGGLTTAGNGSYMEVHALQDVTINQISVLNQMLAPGSATFAIYDATDQSLLLKTAPILLAVDDSATWKTSPIFSYTLAVGHDYVIGSTISAERLEPFDDVPETMNGIQSDLLEWVHDLPMAPDAIREFSGGEPAVRLLAVPEPSTLILAALGGLALSVWRRRA